MKNQIKFIWAGVVIFVLAFTGGCGKSTSSSAGGDSGTSDGSLQAKIEKHGDEIMASSTKAEAREWMKQPKHVFFKADPKQVAQLVEDFYNAGAEQVLIADIEEEEGNQYGESLLIVLPKDAAARAKIFSVGSRADTAFQEDPVTDQGQKYLFYSLD